MNVIQSCTLPENVFANEDDAVALHRGVNGGCLMLIYGNFTLCLPFPFLGIFVVFASTLIVAAVAPGDGDDDGDGDDAGADV